MRERAWTAAAGALALGLFLPGMAPDMGLGLPPADLPVDLIPASRLLVGPGLGAPDGPGWLASTLLARLALSLPFGTPSTRLAALAVAAGVAAALLSFALYRRLSFPRSSALMGSAVVATGPTVLALVTTGSADALLAPLVPGLLLCGLWWADTGRRAALATLAGLTMVAVGSYPAVVLVCGAMAACLAWAGPERHRSRLPAVTLGAVAVGALHRLVAAWSTWRVETGALGLPGGSDAVAGWSWTVPFGTLRLDGAVDRLSALVSHTVTELGLPATLLVAVGAATLGRHAAGRSLTWAWGAALVAIAVWVPSTSPDGPRVVALLAWLLVGGGLDWLWRSSPGRGARLGVAALCVFLVVSAVSLRTTRPWYAELVGSTHVDRFLATVAAGPPAALVTEQPGLDRALRGDPARRMIRVPLARSAVKQLHDAGRPMMAFAGARARLERLGGQFDTVPVPAERVSVRRLLDALPRGSMVAAAGGPALARAAPSTGDPLFAAAGGSSELFGQPAGFYGVIGVIGRGGQALEKYASDAVTLEVEVGDSVGSFPMRAMAAVRVTSDQSGARVELDGRVVAEADVGVALIAVTPDGQLLIAVRDELAHGVETDLVGVDRPLSRLVGWEPCVTLPAGTWVDASAAALAGGVGAWVAAPGDRLTLYATGRAKPPVGVPPEAPRDADATGGVRHAHYRLADDAQRAELSRQLGSDQVPEGDWSAAAVVQRVDVYAASAGAVAIELGEAPARAYARYEPADADQPLELCGLVTGEPLFAAGAPPVATVPMARLDALGWGWHGLERDGRSAFRWSDGPETELLLQLSRIGEVRVEIDASAAAVDLSDAPTTMTLVVNGQEVGVEPMARDVQTYRWQVPATRWKTGMNRLGLRVSASVSPAALGLGDDQRSLGLALRRLELVLAE